MRFNVEYTDTFCGEANYSWVKRAEIELPDDAKDREIMRKAKATVGLTGVRGVTDFCSDTIRFRPFRRNTVMFITW